MALGLISRAYSKVESREQPLHPITHRKYKSCEISDCNDVFHKATNFVYAHALEQHAHKIEYKDSIYFRNTK